ncbi:MAG: VWA domain-containing protein [Deltaproteobacteria bacterium]|nr:VWA domain-containing protein [Deltaproteobacteria bacterium]
MLRRPVLLAALVFAVLPPLYVVLVWGGLLSESYVRFERPWASLLGLPAMAFVALRLAAHQRRQSRTRTALADLLVAAAVLASALAASGPELGRPLDRLAVIAVVDRSRSIDLVPSAEVRLARELQAAEQGMRPGDRIGTVVFGASAAVEDPPRPRSTLPAAQRVAIGRDGTDIGAAIRRALAEVPADSAARLVLLTDGVATRGDAMAGAVAAAASEIPVDVVPLEQREILDVRVVSLHMTPRAAEGETLALRLVVSAPAPTELEIRISRDGRLVRRVRAEVAAGEDVLHLREPALSSGLHRYDVAISAARRELDEAPEDNEASCFVRVRGPARALVLDGEPGKTAFIAAALEQAGFRIEQGATSAVPPDIGAMAGYDLIVMGDIAAVDLAPAQIEALASYVRDLGGGLLLTAGDRSMGPGGYARTPVEEISPVSFDLKQERRRASLAEVIGIDYSGSMAANAGGQSKLELANEAAARSAALLGPGDRLGVEHVDEAARWTVPLAPVADHAAIESAIRAVSPGGGGIFVDLALEQAYAALGKIQVNLKHVLLFADGSDAERLGPDVRAMVDGAQRGRGITTSIVALGQGSDVPELEHLSRLGGGRFYIVEDAQRLPAVFVQETVLASRSAIVEKPFRVARGSSSAVTAGVDFDAAPALQGYVVTIAKSRASVLLTGPESDPILALWSAGVGRAAAFASDLKDRWGGAWTRWPGAARALAQLGRDLSRSEDDGRVRLEADAAGAELHLRASAVDDDGRTASFRQLRVRVSGPDGFAREVSLEAAGAGAYAASVALSRPGAYVAVARDELSGKPVATTGAVLGAGEELRPTGTDYALLGRIAELSGGKRREVLAGIFADRGARRFAYEDMTGALLLAAAFGLFLAVAARRLALPEPVERWLGRAAAWRPRRRRPVRPGVVAGERAEASLAALLEGKERAQRERVAAGPAAEAQPEQAPPAPREAARPAPDPSATAGPPPPLVAAPPRWARAPVARRPAEPVEPLRSEQQAGAPPPSTRPLTAAEILLARRKGRRG